MNLMMIVAVNIFRAGGALARGILGGAVGIAKVIANMLFLQDEIAEGLILKFTDMTDETIWGTVTLEYGVVKGEGLWEVACNVYQYAAIIGFGLFLAYWLINIIEKSNQDRLNGSEFVRLGLQLLVGMVLMMYGPILLKGVANFSNWSIDIVKKGLANEEEAPPPTSGVHSTGNLYMDDALQWIGFRKGINPIQEGAWCGQACDLCYIYVTGHDSNINMEGIKTDLENSYTEDELTFENIKQILETMKSQGLYDKNSPIHGYVESVRLGAGGAGKLEKAWAYYNPGEAIGMMIKAIITLVIEALLFIINLILLVMISATALSRTIQIFLYIMFAPLAFADTFNQGFINSKSWRFIQKFIALCIQAGIIYASVVLAPKVALRIGDAVSKDLPGVGSGSLLKVVISGLFIAIGYLTALGLSQKASQISNDIVGA